MPLVGFQYEPVSLDVKGVCLEEEQDIPNTRGRPNRHNAQVC